MTKIVLDKVEFYITNVCNLTCSNCNRYNNYKFSGWQDWKDYQEIYQAWADKIDITHKVILGGEPLLNPTINDWITGIRQLWPDRYAPQIQSNGTRIDLVPGLYQACRSTGTWIGISVHRKQDLDPIVQRIRNFLQHPIRETQDPGSPMGSNLQFTDTNHVRVHVWISDYFIQSNVTQSADGQFRLYRSDPEKAHANCEFVRHKNYHFIHGKFYKCGPAGLMPEFDQQFGFDITEAEREILYSYRPLTIDEFDSRALEFFQHLDDPIDQCRFCPETWEYKPIYFTDLKNIKI